MTIGFFLQPCHKSQKNNNKSVETQQIATTTWQRAAGDVHGRATCDDGVAAAPDVPAGPCRTRQTSLIVVNLSFRIVARRFDDHHDNDEIRTNETNKRMRQDGVYVRVYEPRIDLLKLLVIAPSSSPVTDKEMATVVKLCKSFRFRCVRISVCRCAVLLRHLLSRHGIWFRALLSRLIRKSATPRLPSLPPPPHLFPSSLQPPVPIFTPTVPCISAIGLSLARPRRSFPVSIRTRRRRCTTARSARSSTPTSTTVLRIFVVCFFFFLCSCVVGV